MPLLFVSQSTAIGLCPSGTSACYALGQQLQLSGCAHQVRALLRHALRSQSAPACTQPTISFTY